MKKRDILTLIRAYSENNKALFETVALQIAKDFDNSGDEELAKYITSVISGNNIFVPQMSNFENPVQKGVSKELTYFEKVNLNVEAVPLLLPQSITKELKGIQNAINNNVGISRFLFQGKPGTGKTETVKQLARHLNRNLYVLDFTKIIDSKLGQTQKNIASLFSEINSIQNPKDYIFLFDEIDAIALDRTNSNDLREMGRAVSILLKFLDDLSDQVILIATTNLYQYFDRAILRRFDCIVNFDKFEMNDLLDISSSLLDYFCIKHPYIEKNDKLIKKIVALMDPVLSPGELKSLIKRSIGFSSSPEEYLSLLFEYICPEKNRNPNYLQKNGFSLREIEILTGVSKSQISRELKEGVNA